MVLTLVFGCSVLPLLFFVCECVRDVCTKETRTTTFDQVIEEQEESLTDLRTLYLFCYKTLPYIFALVVFISLFQGSASLEQCV